MNLANFLFQRNKMAIYIYLRGLTSTYSVLTGGNYLTIREGSLM
jgi:hypothetical protein